MSSSIRRRTSNEMQTDDNNIRFQESIPYNDEINSFYEENENNFNAEARVQEPTLADVLSALQDMRNGFNVRMNNIELNQEHADRKSNRIENRLRTSLETNTSNSRHATFEAPIGRGTNYQGTNNRYRTETVHANIEAPIVNPEYEDTYTGIDSTERDPSIANERMRNHIRDRVDEANKRRRYVPEMTDESIHVLDPDDVINDNPFGNATINRSGRRMTISAIPSVLPGVATAGNNQATVVVTPYEVKESDKMKYISLKSIKRLMEHYAVFKASSLDNTKTLIFFINTECQHKLISNQLVLGTELSKSINPQNIFRVKDSHVEDMLSDYIRPTSRDDFVYLFQQAMTHPRWKKDLLFGTLNYHKDIFPLVTLFLEECEIYDEYLRRGATPYEKDFMPKMEWGKKDPGGMLRIAMAVLHPYQDNFVQLLNEEKLNKITSMKEFIRIFKDKNREVSQISLEILRQNDQMKKPTDFKTIAAQARKKSDEYKEYKDKVAKTGSANATKRSSTYNRYARSKSTLNQIEGDNSTNPESENEEEFFIHPEAFGSDDEDDSFEMTEEEWNQKYDEDRSHQEKVNKEIRNWDDSEVLLALDALCAIQPSYAPRRNHDGIKVYKAKPVNTKEQVCFQYAYGNCTAGNACVYSHDPGKIKGFLKSSLERIMNAPTYEPGILASVTTPRTPDRSGNGSQDKSKSNHGGSHGYKGAAQTPTAGNRKPPFVNNYGKNYVISGKELVEITEKKSSDLPSAGGDQPHSAAKSGSSRVPLEPGSRADSDL